MAAPTIATTLREYDDAGHLVEETSPLGYVTTYAYDRRRTHRGAGRGIRRHPRNTRRKLTWTWAYTYQGNRLRIDETDPVGVTVRTFNDQHNRPVRVEDPRNGITEITYDPAGNVVSRVNGRISVAYTYDALHRVLTSIDAEGKSTAFTLRRTAGRVLSQTDPLGNTTRFVLRRPWSPHTQSTVDAAGGITALHLRRRRATSRPSPIPLGNPTTTLTHDAANRLLTETTRTGTRDLRVRRSRKCRRTHRPERPNGEPSTTTAPTGAISEGMASTIPMR
jgi:YD repeat-containing protein